MIAELEIKNFKCLRDVRIALGPFTVLIGANDSGKSSVLDAIHMLGRTTCEPLTAGLTAEDGVGTDPFEELVWRRDTTKPITWAIRGTSAGEEYSYEVALRAGIKIEAETFRSHQNNFSYREIHSEGFSVDLRDEVRWRVGPDCTAFYSASDEPKANLIAAGFTSTAKYRFDPRSLRRTAPPVSDPVLSSSGDNLAAALDALLTGPDRAAVRDLESALHDAVPTLSGIALRTVATKSEGSSKAIEFTLAGSRPPVTIPAAHASEGALLLTAFLALAYGATPEVLLIEEPENGLHPTRLQTVIDVLRKLSTGEVGNRARQVIMTTHSPLLLNYVRPDEVRILRRDPEQGTKVTAMTQVPNIDKLIQEFAIGELWYPLTEEGLLNGERPSCCARAQRG